MVGILELPPILPAPLDSGLLIDGTALAVSRRQCRASPARGRVNRQPRIVPGHTAFSPRCPDGSRAPLERDQLRGQCCCPLPTGKRPTCCVWLASHSRKRYGQHLCGLAFPSPVVKPVAGGAARNGRFTAR